MKTDSNKAATYAFVSLGCPKNLVDSERMLGLLRGGGYELVDEPDGADFVVVNTCGFIDAARGESMAAIDEMLRLKREGRTRGVIVAGCLAERQKERLLAERPDIDGLVGVFARDEIARMADRFIGNPTEQRTLFRPATIRPLEDTGRFRVTPRHFAYLKVSEGCDRLCTFCSIPSMRGRHVSKPIEAIVEEARQLAADGARELVLVAQDTTYYGRDRYGASRLADLLAELDRIEDVDWIRVMYAYPMYIDDPLIDVIGRSRAVVPYLDMPLQHCNDAVLRRMARRVTRDETEILLAKLRARIPKLAVRTTVIVGFPGETDEQFAELEAFVERQRFERLGVFTYSLEPDTPSASLSDPVPDSIREDRRARLMAAQQAIAFRANAERVGTACDVLLDAPIPGETNVFAGRTPWDAPDVDACVYVTGQEEKLAVGSIVPCEIVAWKDYDLIAVPVGPPR